MKFCLVRHHLPSCRIFLSYLKQQDGVILNGSTPAWTGRSFIGDWYWTPNMSLPGIMCTVNMSYWSSVRSRWLDIGQVRFLRVYGLRRSRGPYTRKKRMRPISSHLAWTNLVNKGFIIWLSGNFFLWDTAGIPKRAK